MMLAAALLAASAPALVVSPAAKRLSVTVYRDPDRSRYRPMNLGYLNGFALVTETRMVRLPPGEATIRFEGVAGGIIPASAIIDGLPGGTVEKNRDARLLSPAALVDGTLGRHVTIRRTDKASGKTSEEDAEIVAGPAQGVVLRTASGIETLRCSGLAEQLRYDRVPADLSRQADAERRHPQPARRKRDRHALLPCHRLRLERELCRDAGGRRYDARPVRLADAGQCQPRGLRRCADAGGRGPSFAQGRAALRRGRGQAGAALLSAGHHHLGSARA